MSEQNTCSSCADKDSCGGTCEKMPESLLEAQNAFSNVKKVIAVVSGKGGVGKSMVTALMATEARRKGYRVGILDADITGPSVPRMFGITKKADGNDMGMFPGRSANDIGIISINMLLEKEDDPVVWRGPMIAGVVKQFWSEVMWGDVDYLFVDMPPGTGDVPLTVFQSIPVDGVVVVTSPQDMVNMIVRKSYNMAKMMNVPVLGIVENMSHYVCEDCGKEIKVFGESKTQAIADALGLPLLSQIPIDPNLADLCDKGEIERNHQEYMLGGFKAIEEAYSVPGLNLSALHSWTKA